MHGNEYHGCRWRTEQKLEEGVCHVEQRARNRSALCEDCWRLHQPAVKRSIYVICSKACNIRLYVKHAAENESILIENGGSKNDYKACVDGIDSRRQETRDVTGSQPVSNSAWLVDNFTDQLWLCCFINSISRLQLAALLLGASFTNSLSSGGWEWCQQRERGGKNAQQTRQGTFWKLCSNCFESLKEKKRFLKMKNWSTALFNQALNQKMSLWVPLSAKYK